MAPQLAGNGIIMMATHFSPKLHLLLAFLSGFQVEIAMNLNTGPLILIVMFMSLDLVQVSKAWHPFRRTEPSLTLHAMKNQVLGANFYDRIIKPAVKESRVKNL